MLHFHNLMNQIKKRREMLNITQEVLADLSGVGLRTIKQLEAGKGNPTFRTIHEVADVLGLALTLEIKKLNNT